MCPCHLTTRSRQNGWSDAARASGIWMSASGTYKALTYWPMAALARLHVSRQCRQIRPAAIEQICMEGGTLSCRDTVPCHSPVAASGGTSSLPLSRATVGTTIHSGRPDNRGDRQGIRTEDRRKVDVHMSGRDGGIKRKPLPNHYRRQAGFDRPGFASAPRRQGLQAAYQWHAQHSRQPSLSAKRP